MELDRTTTTGFKTCRGENVTSTVNLTLGISHVYVMFLFLILNNDIADKLLIIREPVVPNYLGNVLNQLVFGRLSCP